MQDIHNIRPPVPAGFDLMILWIVLGIIFGVALLLMAALVIRKRLKTKKEPSTNFQPPQAKPPYEVASAALERLKTAQLADARLFYFELTMVLRRFLDGSFTCHTCEMTSQEFVRALPAMDLDRMMRERIVGFVNACDPIKYGGAVPEPHRVQEDIDRVQTLVTSIHTRIKTAQTRAVQEDN